MVGPAAPSARGCRCRSGRARDDRGAQRGSRQCRGYLELHENLRDNSPPRRKLPSRPITSNSPRRSRYAATSYRWRRERACSGGRGRRRHPQVHRRQERPLRAIHLDQARRRDPRQSHPKETSLTCIRDPIEYSHVAILTRWWLQVGHHRELLRCSALPVPVGQECLGETFGTRPGFGHRQLPPSQGARQGVGCFVQRMPSVAGHVLGFDAWMAGHEAWRAAPTSASSDFRRPIVRGDCSRLASG